MWRPLGAGAVVFALTCALAAGSAFTIETSAFLNGGALPKTDASADDHCGGRNISPPLQLVGYPDRTRSFAVILFDPDAGKGRGFTHWVAYGIPTAHAALRPGFGSAASPTFTGGINDAGTSLYWGPCPPVGDPPHHYIFTVFALDLLPGALPSGLSRAALMKALRSHTLAQAEITGRYGR